VEIVDQPLRGRRDSALLADGAPELAIRLAQDATVVLHARQQAAASRPIAHDGLRGGEALGMLLEPLDSEQLRADRLLDDYASAFTM
jgi:hypothetical protein